MEQKRERRTLLLAILASILLHFAVAISLASFGDKLQPSLPQDEEKPSELTLVDLPPTPPVVNKNAPFIDTPENRQAKEFGKGVLELLIKRAPRKELAKDARRKLKSEGLA